MKIGCVYSTLIEMHLRIIDSIKKSKTNEVLLLYLQREFGCTWRYYSNLFLLSSGLYRIERI